MAWEFARKLVKRSGSELLFEIDLREDGVLRDTLQLSCDASLGAIGIKTKVKRAAVDRLRELLVQRGVGTAEGIAAVQ